MALVQELRELTTKQVVRLGVLAAIFGLFLFFSLVSKGYLMDPDIWWHLKVGDWIVQHHAVPEVGILSRTAADHQWVAYSWGFEVLLSRIYRWTGLVGFAYFAIILAQMVIAILFGTCYALSGRFWRSSFLTLFGGLAYVYSLYPRPVFFSMILFTLMLYMILQAQRSGRIQPLYWFPLLFLIWANLHIQFIYGLATFGLFIVVEMSLRLAARMHWNLDSVQPASLPLSQLMGILAACFATSCIGPYSYRLFVVVVKYSKATQTYSVIQELQSPSFTGFTYYMFLFLILGAFYAVGWRKKIDLFRLSLLLVATVCSFRTVRDAWFPIIPAALFLADFPLKEEGREERVSKQGFCVFASVMVVLTFLLGSNMAFNERGIDFLVSQEYPVDASNFVRQTRPPGPLYNDFNWGGFLTWYLPDYPVVVDGRNDLYGDEFVARHIMFSVGDKTEGDPRLDEAGVVMLPKETPLAKLMKRDTRFRLVFEDRLADVFYKN
jgi:hypothetical protein